MRVQRRLERNNVRPVRRPQYDDDVDSVRAHQSPEIEVARIVEENSIAGLYKQAADEIEGLRQPSASPDNRF